MARPMRNPFFKCPNCNALYQVIRGESGPETTTDREVPCRVYGALRVRSPPAESLFLPDARIARSSRGRTREPRPARWQNITRWQRQRPSQNCSNWQVVSTQRFGTISALSHRSLAFHLRKCSIFRDTKTRIRTESLRTQVCVGGKRNF